MSKDEHQPFDNALAEKTERKAMPRGSFGRLERLALQVARVQRSLTPDVTRARVVLFAADHGIAVEGVTAREPGSTRLMVDQVARGQAAVCIMAQQVGMDVHVVNTGVKGGPFDVAGVRDAPLGEGTGNILQGPAMSSDLLYRAMRTGRRIGAEGDWQVMGFSDLAVGNSASASIIAHRLTGAPLTDVIGRGKGMDGTGLLRKAEALEAANARVPESLGPERALGEYGGFEMAMMTGAMLGAAEAGRIILVDGFVASVSALAAAQIMPEARAAMILCQASLEPGYAHILDALGARSVLDLDNAVAQGTGAALTWPILRAAVAMFNELPDSQT